MADKINLFQRKQYSEIMKNQHSCFQNSIKCEKSSAANSIVKDKFNFLKFLKVKGQFCFRGGREGGRDRISDSL
jgi:hypothetical protein